MNNIRTGRVDGDKFWIINPSLKTAIEIENNIDTITLLPSNKIIIHTMDCGALSSLKRKFIPMWFWDWLDKYEVAF